LRTSISHTPPNSKIDLSNLKAGDVILYTAEGKQGYDIADSTNGHFSHAALYVGSSTFSDGETLHTGRNGATLIRCSQEFSNALHGVYVVRLSSSIDEKELYRLACESKGKEYDFGALKYVGLASWDIETLENKTGIHRFIPEAIGTKIVEKLNKKGSYAICSGLTLDLIQKCSKDKILPKAKLELKMMSPNCIYREARKADNNAEIFELAPISEEYKNRNKKNFMLAGLSLGLSS
jgi:hypothetical protein